MKVKKEDLLRIVKEETEAALKRYRLKEASVSSGSPSSDEQQSAKDQGMKPEVVRVAKYMFKHPQLGPALKQVDGDIEAAQLLGLLAQVLGVETADISNVMQRVKKKVKQVAIKQ